MTSNIVKIANGPSREDMFDSLRLGTIVTFYLEDGRIIDGKVTCLEMEDGSRYSWIFKLYDPKQVLGENKILGYQNTRTRSGHVQPCEE